MAVAEVLLCVVGEWRSAVQPSSSSSSVTSQCQCGCTLTDRSGHIIASARHRCRTTIRRWTIHVDAHYTIRLTINYLRLSRSSSVRVYDTAKSTAPGTYLPLLLKLPNDARDEDASMTAVTSGNRMLIEYIVVDRNEVTAARSSDGFTASYVTSTQFTGTAPFSV